MQAAARVQATIELLEQVVQTAKPADRIMSQYFRSRRYIGSKDKAAISEYLYAAIRQKLSLEYLLEQADLPTYSRFLVAALLRVQGEPFAEHYNGEGYSPKPLNPDDAAKLQQLSKQSLEQAPLNVQLNVPEWLAGKLQAALGEQYISEMQASNQRAVTDIRVNLLKSTASQVISKLSDVGYKAELTQLSPWGIRFTERVALFNLDIFKNGWIEIQDQGSQLLALLTGAKPGQKVVDFCAGAGGKTLAMAAMMNNKGTIYACDVHSRRLAEMSKRASRAGAHNIRSHVLSSENDKWVKKHRAQADVVLIDAPCSGTGTWRRSPDSRWNLTPEGLENLINLQQSILQSASRLTKPGGLLFYATCSLLSEENESQIETFLQANPSFERHTIDLPQSLQNNLDLVDYQDSQLRMSPKRSGTDGFYLCALRNKPPQ